MKLKPTTCGSLGSHQQVQAGKLSVRGSKWSLLSVLSVALLCGVCVIVSGCQKADAGSSADAGADAGSSANAGVKQNPEDVEAANGSVSASGAGSTLAEESRDAYSEANLAAAVSESVPNREAEVESQNQNQQKPKRLARGEMPEEWIEEQRERVVPIDTTGDQLDLTFDDLKFDIEVGQAFERELLSEEVKALHGKEITLSGYMRPSFKAAGLKGFIFVRDDKECCFGPQAAIYDCVRVKLSKGTDTDYIVRPFKVRGDFYLKEREGPDGTIWSIFNMKNAKIER